MAHNRFDKGARYIAKLDPLGILCWLLRLKREALLWGGWVDTRGVPFPGEPDYVCDTVAFVQDVLRHQVPWAHILEFQLTPDALMFGRFLAYGGNVWLQCKPSEERGDRFHIGAVCVNLTGRGQASREMRWDEAGLATVLQVREINLCDEDAAATLKRIAAGAVTKAALAFIPLMHGGGESATIRDWVSVAGGETEARRRGDYGGLALVFAEAAGCHELWKEALKGWNAVESQQILEWQNEARTEARAETRAQDIIRLLQLRFQAIPPDLAAGIQRSFDATRLEQWFDLAYSCNSVADFRQLTGI